MVSKELQREMGRVYAQLERKLSQIVNVLVREGFDITFGWYNGHYRKDSEGNWIRDAYPIPVISVNGLCDIEIQFDELTVTTKLARAVALAYSYERISQYEYEVYGVEEYLNDYSHQGQTLEELLQVIADSNESEIGFSFAFSTETEDSLLMSFVRFIRYEGFYY